MSFIRSRRHLTPRSVGTTAPVALGLVFTALHGAASAQATGEQTLPAVRATATAPEDFKTDSSASPKQTRPLVDTPQTITVVKKELLQEQGATTLMEALRNTPGITMQLGEGGRTNIGDAFYLRGFAADANVFVDGVRDLGPVTRDVFNLEQVEIVKGPAGADVGRGATGGYVNLITKLPQAEDFVAGSFAYGSGDVKRATADLNRQLAPGIALRLDAMASDGGVPGRDEVRNRSQGIAPSIAFGLGGPTRLFLQSQHVRLDNRPDGGVTTIGLPGFYDSDFATGGAAAGVAPRAVDPASYYGSTNDREQVRGDMFTLRFEHDFSRTLKLINLARYGQAHTDRLLTSVNAVTAPSTDPATWTVERRRHSNLQRNEILANQTLLRAELAGAGLKHQLAAGLEFAHERQNVTGKAVPGATNNVIPSSPVYAPDASAGTGPEPVENGTYQHGRVSTAAAFVFDTIELGPQWQLLAGLRHERYRANTERADLVGDVLTPSDLGKSGSLSSWKLGAVYKPRPNGSVYLAYANAYTPPGGNNLTLASPTVSGTSADRSDLQPQQSQNLEVGTKWELLAGRVALTAAWYRSTNRNELIEVDDDVYAASGKRRVQGVELGAVGQITPAWQLSAGLTTMDSKLLNGAIEGTNAQDAPSRWTPQLAATFWTHYKFGDRYAIGGGARYLGKQQRSTDPRADLSVTNMPSIPSSWVADAMASVAINTHVSLQFNVYNLFDKSYIATLNNNGNRYLPGAPRSATLTASFLF